MNPTACEAPAIVDAYYATHPAAERPKPMRHSTDADVAHARRPSHDKFNALFADFICFNRGREFTRPDMAAWFERSGHPINTNTLHKYLGLATKDGTIKVVSRGIKGKLAVYGVPEI